MNMQTAEIDIANLPFDQFADINTDFTVSTPELSPLDDKEFDMGLPSELVHSATSVLPSLNLDADFSTVTAAPSMNPFVDNFQPESISSLSSMPDLGPPFNSFSQETKEEELVKEKLKRKANEIWNLKNAEITLPHIDLSKPLDLIELERGGSQMEKPRLEANVGAWSSDE